MRRILIVGAAMAGLASSVSAQGEPQPACAAIDSALPDDLAAWGDRAALIDKSLRVGRAATVALRPVSEVHFPIPPQKQGKVGSFGGSAKFDIARAGTYRVSLSEGAWIDVISGGKLIASSSHGHGPDCTSIRKIVAFPLRPGRYTLQLSGSPKPAIAVLVTPAV